MAACGGDDDASDKRSFKQEIIGEWVSEDDGISLNFSETILTYTKGKEQFRFPYTFTTQNNNINVSYATVLYSEDNGTLWGPYAPKLTDVPTSVPAEAQVYNVQGWTNAGNIDNYRIFGYAVKYKYVSGSGSDSKDAFTTYFFESFSQNWKIVSIETKEDAAVDEDVEEEDKAMIMNLETARLQDGEPRLATYEFTKDPGK
jgi:hypothetical protein